MSSAQQVQDFKSKLRSQFASGGRAVSSQAIAQTKPSNQPPVATTAQKVAPKVVSPQATQASQTPQLNPVSFSTNDQLDVLDSVLAQALPQAALQASDTLNPPKSVSVGKTKETHEPSTSTATAEAAPGAGPTLEIEQAPETEHIPLEVEEYLERVKEHSQETPQEIVVADGQVTMAPHRPKKPVIVLPITPEEEKKGARKKTKWSIRWLVEFSKKVMKMFSGQVVYREM